MPEARVKRTLALAAAVGAAAVVALLVVGRSAPPGQPREPAGAGSDRAVPGSGGAVAAPAPAPAAPSAAASIPGEEEALMTQLRQLVDADPRRALELAREARHRFPEGELADERSWLEMRALVHLGEIAPARDEAVAFFQRFPRSPYAGKVSRLTGVHPRPRPQAP